MLDYANNEDFDRRGFGLLEKGRFEEAATVFKDAIKVYPFSGELYSGLGQAYGEMGEYVMAARAFRSGLNYSPLDEEMWYGLGLCCLKLNRLSEAQECFGKAEHGILGEPEAQLHLAFAYYQIEHSEEAAAYCQKVLDQEPDNSEALALLGICLYETEAPADEVQACLKKAIELEPGRWEWVEYYANLLYEEGDREEAFQLLDSIPLEELRSPDSLKRLIKLLRRHRKDTRKIRECKRLMREVATDESFDSFLYSLQEDCERVDEENA